MTPSEFQALSYSLLKTNIGWQTKIARKLGIAPRTVRRWLAAGEIPDHAAKSLRDMIGLSDPGQIWPRGEWLVGHDEAGRKMLHHMQTPKFTARIVYCEPDGSPIAEEGAADVLSGTVYVIDGGDPEGDVVLCEIAWFEPPHDSEVVQLLEAAADAFENWEASR